MTRAALAAMLLGAAIGCHHPREVSLAPMSRAAYAHYLDARLASAAGDWPRAAEAYGAAAAAAPEQPMIAVGLARALAKAGRADAARATLAATRASWPEHAEVWLASAELLAGSDPPAAIRAYRLAIELAPADERGYLGLVKLQPAGDAARTLHALVAHVPGSAPGHYLLAQRAERDEDWAHAIPELRAVLELDPDQIDARLDLARAQRRSGHLADAIATTRSVFDRTGQALDVAQELFDLLGEAGDLDGATDLLTLLDDDRSDVDALTIVARLDRGLGRLDAARAATTRLAAADTDAGTIAFAELDAASGDPIGGATRALTVAEDSPHFAQARRVAADALLDAGDPAHALAALEPARRAHPADLGLALLAAFAEVDLGHADAARAALAPVDPARTTELAIARARVEDRLGDHHATLALLEPLLAAPPAGATAAELADAANLAGFILADASTRLPDAERYLRRARALAPGDPAVLDSAGWLLLRTGHAHDAVRELARASRLAPREPEILLHLAAAALADHDAAAATRALDAAAALHPPAGVQRRLDTLRASLPPVLR